MSSSSQSLSVIIPVFNEKGTLSEAIGKIDAYLVQTIADYEIVAIESGSTDGSGEICDRLAVQYPSFRVIHEGARNGFGAAVRLGYKNVVKDLIVLLTTDIPFPLEAIGEALTCIGERDCVLSYRSKDTRSMFRRVQSCVYNLLVKTALDVPFRHVNSAFKLLRRTCVADVEFLSKGWLFDAELLSHLSESGATCIEMPVPLIERKAGNSSVGLFAFLGVLKELRALLRHRKRKGKIGGGV